MATKNLSRTVIEGGRATFSKNARHASNETHRAQARAFCAEATRLVDVDDAAPAPMRRPVRKDFDDKLGPMYRWLLSQVSRPWRKVYSELVTKFDTRTVAGRHVVFSHMLSDITLQPTDVRHRGIDSFFIDGGGILRLSPRNRWNRRSSYRDRNRLTARDVENWVAGRRVMDYGVSLFWMIPERTEWNECGHFVGRHWSRGYFCKRGEHRDATKLAAVPDASKLLAIEKMRLRAELKDGITTYYREQKIRQCRQGRGLHKQGARFAQADLDMWARLDQRDRDALLWVKR